MAESAKEQKKAETSPQPQKAAGDAGGQPARQQQTITLDDSKASECYANFCSVTGTPEEMILYFGLNSDQSGRMNQRMAINQKLIINYFTAKRLLGLLQVSVQRHEAVFGVLETDVQKRVTPEALSQAQAAQAAQAAKADAPAS